MEVLNVDSKIPSIEDKKGMDRFLSNTWLKFVIEKKVFILNNFD